MESIINPWFIYFIGISENITSMCQIITVLCCIISIFTFLIVGAFTFITDDMDSPKLFWFTNIPLGILLTFSIVISILIPEREWIIGTAVAASLTEDRAEKIWEFTRESGGDITDYTLAIKNELKSDLVDLIETIKENDNANQNNIK